MRIVTETELRIIHRHELADLAKLDLRIMQFTEYHYRVDDRFDVFPNDRGGDWRWRDINSADKGWLTPRKIPTFVPAYLREHPAPKSPYPANAPAQPIEPVNGEQSFEQQLKELYIADAHWDVIWALVKAKLEERF